MMRRTLNLKRSHLARSKLVEYSAAISKLERGQGISVLREATMQLAPRPAREHLEPKLLDMLRVLNVSASGGEVGFY